MPNRVWGAGSVMDGNWGTNTCWTGDVVPQAGDDVIFDNTDDTNCLMNVAPAALGSMDVQAGYDGDIDTSDEDFSCGNMTFDGAGTVDCTSSQITCSGNWDGLHQAFTVGTSLLKMTGAAKTFSSAWNGRMNLEISGTISSVANPECNNITILNGGTYTIPAWTTLHVYGAMVVNIGGTLTGPANSVSNFRHGSSVTNAGTYSATATWTRDNVTIGNGTYGGTWNCENNDAGAGRTLTLGLAGGETIIFTAEVVFDADTGQTYTVDLNTNDPAVEFRGDVDITETGGGTLTWSKGSGSVTFAGAVGVQQYTDNTAAIQDLGTVYHDDNGYGSILQLLSDMECSNFFGVDGEFDVNGMQLDDHGALDWATGYLLSDPVGGDFVVGGNFTADAQDISGASGAWTLTVTGTAVASGAGKVKNSDASGGTEIDASAVPWEDTPPGGTNTNWNFGAVGAIMNQMQGANLGADLYNGSLLV